jgi:two-component system sensor histidine kinase MprB
MSLRNRLTLSGGGVVFCALLLVSLILYPAVGQKLHDQLDVSLVRTVTDAPRILDQLKRKASGQGANVGLGGLVTVGPTTLQFLFEPVSAGPARAFTAVTERDVAVARRRGPAYFQNVTYKGIGYRVYTAALPEAGNSLVRIARPLSDTSATLRRLLVLLITLTIGGALLAAAVARLAAGRVLSPVRTLTETIGHIAATNELAARIDVPQERPGNRDEIRRLSASFNAMMAALETSVLAQQALVADASHELRTPLTSLTTDLDLLAEGQGLADPAAPELLMAARHQVHRLRTLVNDLLDLARYGMGPAHTEDLRLDLVAIGVAERTARRFPALTFDMETEEVLVHGDPDAIERAIANLVDNAVKWSPPDGRIWIRVKTGEFVIRDQGPGIPEADIPHVFDRFYRSAAGRATPGSGLGLAIVRQIAEAHGGAVTVEPASTGACLRLRLETSPVR